MIFINRYNGKIFTAGNSGNRRKNWTDVSGILMADPRIVENPKRIDKITYSELRELSYMGANVLPKSVPQSFEKSDHS